MNSEIYKAINAVSNKVNEMIQKLDNELNTNSTINSNAISELAKSVDDIYKRLDKLEGGN